MHDRPAAYLARGASGRVARHPAALPIAQRGPDPAKAARRTARTLTAARISQIAASSPFGGGGDLPSPWRIYPDEHGVDIILGPVKQPRFTLTEAKAGAFNDFLLKTRVHALLAASLAGDLSRITVTVHGSVVKREGMLTSGGDYIDQMVEQVRRLEGVKGVDAKR